MLGLFVFRNIFINLGEECQNKIIGNIFGIGNVSVSNFVIRDNKFIFRLFSGGVFYQYSFLFDDVKNMNICIDRNINGKFLVCDETITNSIYCLIRCCDEYQVYLLLREFL